jgi:hypothetical protein
MPGGVIAKGFLYASLYGTANPYQYFNYVHCVSYEKIHIPLGRVDINHYTEACKYYYSKERRPRLK